MTNDDEDFVLDTDGNLVLIGLTFEETREFAPRKFINETGPFPHIDRDEWHRSEEKRWLELWDKHQSARALFERVRSTRH